MFYQNYQVLDTILGHSKSKKMEKEEQLNNLRRELLVSYLMQETGLQSEYYALQCLGAANWNYNRARSILLENPYPPVENHRNDNNFSRILHPTQCTVLPSYNQYQNNSNNNNCTQSSHYNANNSSHTLKVPQRTNSPSSPCSNVNPVHTSSNQENSLSHSYPQNNNNNSISSTYKNEMQINNLDSNQQQQQQQPQSNTNINLMTNQLNQMNLK